MFWMNLHISKDCKSEIWIFGEFIEQHDHFKKFLHFDILKVAARSENVFSFVRPLLSSIFVWNSQKWYIYSHNSVQSIWKRFSMKHCWWNLQFIRSKLNNSYEPIHFVNEPVTNRFMKIQRKRSTCHRISSKSFPPHCQIFLAIEPEIFE